MISTRKVKLDPANIDKNIIREAADTIKSGGLVIIPTETVYGIAANMRSNKTVDRLYEIKKRPNDKPFSLLIESRLRVSEFAKSVPVDAYKLMDKFWPGPLTLIVRSNDEDKVGLRLPDNEIAQRIVGLAGVPVCCPSANLSGKVPPVNYGMAIEDLDGLVDLAIDAGDTSLQVESTIVDLTVVPLHVVREGAVKAEDVLKAAKNKIVLFICTGNSCRSVMAQAYLRKRLNDRGRFDVEVLSAGLMLMGGLGATESTQEVLKKEGIDVSGHHSQRISRELLDKSDMVFVMEKIHEKRVLEIAPEAKNRVFLLKEFAKITDDGLEVADPIGRPPEFYQKTFSVIKDSVERILKVL